MGTYTKIYCTCQVKKEYEKELINMCVNNKEWEDSKLDLFKEFGKDERAGYIKIRWRMNQFGETRFNFNGELKNYDDTIENFINVVLNEIVQTLHLCYTLHENSNTEIIYEMKEKIIEVI